MKFKYIRPSGILAEYIKYYWILEASATEGRIWERVVPTGNIELMFHYKNCFVCQNKEILTQQPRSFISGISNQFVDVATDGDSGVIAVTFYPFGACNFFRFPLQEIENTNTSLYDIDDAGIRLIEERIGASRDLSERISIIEQYLLSRFRPIIFDDLKLMREGVKIINDSSGSIDISNLSKNLFMTEKSLQRKFSSLIGKTPKQYARIVRFQKIIKSLSTSEKRNLTEIGLEHGYFDQAHFIRDFKSFSGYTPKEFLLHCPCSADYFL